MRIVMDDTFLFFFYGTFNHAFENAQVCSFLLVTLIKATKTLKILVSLFFFFF